MAFAIVFGPPSHMDGIARAQAKDRDAPGVARVVVQPESRVTGPGIVLADIAEFQGVSSLVSEAMGQLELGKSPKPGQVKALNPKRLISRIRAFANTPDDLAVDLPEVVYVKREGRSLDMDMVQALVADFVATRMGDGEIDIDPLQIRGKKIYPVGEMTLEAEARQSRVGKRGSLTLVALVRVDGQDVDRIRISSRIRQWKDVLVAAGNIPRGKVLTEDDFEFVRRDVFALRGTPVTDVEVAVGKTLKRELSRGAVVDAARLVVRPVIQKGDVVTLVARNGNVRIVTSGISREDGYRDRPIRVENLRSGKVVRGLVIEGTTVEVMY
ncbi:MAG: flagellar basal body P-ring formation chaperone FlgA [Desulfobacterales bacterium]|nr:flagellar basal body P-ring formation chaperone FlgA [Desulfobacterales bacterium]